MVSVGVALVLVVFGFVAGFSIGAPFLYLGLGMLILHPFRSRPRVYWPLLGGLAAFLVGTALVVPMSCTALGTVGGSSVTICSSLVGLTWSGSGAFNPPPEASELAIRVGLVAGATVAAATWSLLTIRQRHRGPDEIHPSQRNPE